MNVCNPIVSRGPRMRCLAAGLASAFGIAGAAAWPADSVAATVYVQNCLNSGGGSLRDTIAAAKDGDTVSLGANLPCSTISLTSGAITIKQSTLYLSGPGASALAISGTANSGVLRHSGAGTLAITGLTIRDGKYASYSSPFGGCIYSASNVTLLDSTVANCAVEGTNGATARGGGVFARGTVGIRNSTITGNVAFGDAVNALGGGVYAKGTLVAKYSIFSNNEASHGPNAFYSKGGGLWTRGTTYLLGSLVAGNQADLAGGLGTETAVGGTSLAIKNSTISGNSAFIRVGGVYTHVPMTLTNSTIAFNRAADGGALYTLAAPLSLQSSIIADNEAAGIQNDLDGVLNPPPTGYNNLITSSTIGFPSGTITSCPKLGPLAANGGGAMLTHALLSSSPAINAGYSEPNLLTDQRGSGFPRVAGASTDIGAFERQGGPDDRISVHGLDPICDH